MNVRSWPCAMCDQPTPVGRRYCEACSEAIDAAVRSCAADREAAAS